MNVIIKMECGVHTVRNPGFIEDQCDPGNWSEIWINSLYLLMLN